MNLPKSILHYFQFTLPFFLLILLQFCSLTVLAQEQPADYQLFRQDATYFFYSEDANNSRIVGIRLDSAVVTGEGTEWYNHKSVFMRFISPEMYWCFQPDGPSWMGWKVLVKPNGDNVLYGWVHETSQDAFADTILIKTSALPGDSWNFLRAGENLETDETATVIRCDTMTFLGITDSIKVIDLGVDSLILSKQHGLVRALNFKDFFPYQTNYAHYTIDGITANDTIIGTCLMTWGDIFNYEIGDIFHRSSHISGWPYATLYEIFEVLDKTYSAYQDSVYYEMSRIQWFVGPEGTSIPQYDTLSEVYGDLDNFISWGKLPTETVWGEDSTYFYDYSMFHGSVYNGRSWTSGPYTSYYSMEPPDSCYEMMSANYLQLIEGCGSYLHIYDDYHDCAPCQQLDYFNKGEEEWGTPFTIPTGIEEPVRSVFKIYPNPVDDDLYIEFSDNSEVDVVVKVISCDGKLLFFQNYIVKNNDKISVDFNGFSKGIYFVNISGTGYSESFKILKN